MNRFKMKFECPILSRIDRGRILSFEIFDGTGLDLEVISGQI